MTSIHICLPPNTKVRRLIRCKTCRGIRRCVQRIYLWLDPTFTCCGCGNDPYIRGCKFHKITRYRAELIRKAKEGWDEATTLEKAVHTSMDLPY